MGLIIPWSRVRVLPALLFSSLPSALSRSFPLTKRTGIFIHILPKRTGMFFGASGPRLGQSTRQATPFIS